ncbi:MAG: uridine phosphorylase [Deltaproteobacteria bacterium HGW-Deltaproteobacteria-9]|nr:MAG: uridine phosphorylase [Deltaproteobacteria bacterium HGW-Deltaproteobacteria-9]
MIHSQNPVLSVHKPGGPFSAADLPIDDQGRVYHLQIKPEQLAPDILLVGDPGRADFIGATFFKDIETHHQHRGLITVTGIADGVDQSITMIAPLRTSVVTSGMGTPSLEIIVNELVLLNEIDFSTLTRKPEFPRLHILRLGTSGALQASTPLGTPIITTYAIGLDNSGLYYDVPFPDDHCHRLEGKLKQLMENNYQYAARFSSKIQPYVSRAHPEMVKALWNAAQHLGIPVKQGLTVSCPGFFSSQGRDVVRIQPSIPDIDQLISGLEVGLDSHQIENMEMEASFLLHFLGGLGYWAGVICPTIANRRQNTFDSHYQESVYQTTRIALQALADLRKKS